MTLAQRLLFAIGLVTVTTTFALALGVREAWREAEEERFRAQQAQAMARLERELAEQIRDLSSLLAPLCRHDPMVDSVLVDLRAGRLDESRRLSISLRVPELQRAFRLDEMLLFTESGQILGAGHAPGLVGKVDPLLAGLIREGDRPARLRKQPPLAVVSHCVRRDDKRAVGVFGARTVEQLLAQVGDSFGVQLSLEQPAPDSERMVQTLRLAELGDVLIVASQSRMPLTRALKQLDRAILLIGTVTVSLALAVALLLSRGLARPIVSLSRQARAVVAGDPKPVRGGGGKELEELADAFNQALLDLAQLRKRLAATERIAARREIARRVAHEIKNPLAPIRAAVETLRRLRARSDPAFDEYFDEASRTVLDEVQRISNIVTEFTRFARLPPPAPAPLDLVEVARPIVALHAGGAVPVQLHSEPCPIISADRDQLIQVITNLVNNACEAAASAPSPQVWVELRPEGDRVLLRVRDNGPGVAPEMRERLFEPYATTKAQGTGLGLAIVERIVTEHGGDISYSDHPAGGAVFTVSLPVSGPSLLPNPPDSSRMIGA